MIWSSRGFALCFALCAFGAMPTLALAVVISSPNCNESTLNNALNTLDVGGGGTVTFACGSSPVTIPFNFFISINGNDTIDGGGLITFDGGGSSAFFQISNGHSLTLRNLTLQHGEFNGGHPLDNFGTLTLVNVTATLNNVKGSVVQNNGGTLLIESSTFSNNILSTSVLGDSKGAAVDNEGGSAVATISASHFDYNTVSSVGGAGSSGGAIYNDGDLHVYSSTFTNNSAADGGAIDNNLNATLHISHSTFTSNTASYGGAIESFGTSVNVTGSTFSSNNTTGHGDGGAIWNEQGALTVDTSVFSGNTSGTTGGAISCYGDSLDVSTSTLSGNHSGQSGAGIYSGCALTVSNTTFQGNVVSGGATFAGGAIYQIGNFNSSLVYVTLSGNQATAFGGGIYNDAGTSTGNMSVAKSMFTGNTPDSCAGGDFISGGYSLASDSTCGGLFGLDASNKSNATLPLGTLSNNGGPTPTMSPLSGNEAINFIPGASCGVAYDQRGGLRPAATKCDSGAVELNAVIDSIFVDGFEFH